MKPKTRGIGRQSSWADIGRRGLSLLRRVSTLGLGLVSLPCGFATKLSTRYEPFCLTLGVSLQCLIASYVHNILSTERHKRPPVLSQTRKRNTRQSFFPRVTDPYLALSSRKLREARRSGSDIEAGTVDDACKSRGVDNKMKTRQKEGARDSNETARRNRQVRGTWRAQNRFYFDTLLPLQRAVCQSCELVVE